MKISLSDIEPILAQRIRDEEQQITEGLRVGRQFWGWTPFHEAIKVREAAKSALRTMTVLGVPLLALVLFAALYFIRASSDIVLGSRANFLVVIPAVIAAYFINRHYHRRIAENAEFNFASRGLPVVARSKEEKLYSDLVEELSQASGTTEDAARSLLREMNALMGSYRALEQRMESGKKAMGNRSVEGLEAELRGLKQRAEQAADPVTREALEQSVQLCASRVESAKALTLAQERAKAQQEVVLQTLGSVHAAFAHMRHAPNAVRFDAEQLVETVNALQNRTRAVEQAVEELMTIHTG